jgi:FtsX-like permease family
VLVLLATLAGGVVVATLAGAQRTYTAVQRLNSKTLPVDVMVLPNQPGFDWSRVRTLPSVKRLGTFVLTTGPSPQGVGVNLDAIAGFPAGDTVQNIAVDRPALISGRLANPGSPYEIVVTPGFIERYGHTITVRLPTHAQAAALTSSNGPPPSVQFRGPIVHLHAVGVGINTFDLGPGNGPAFMPTFAFFRDFIRPNFPPFENARVRLRGAPASIPAFRRQLAAITHNSNIDVVDWRESVRPIERAAIFTSMSWLLFSLIALLASLVVVSQAFVRFSAVRSDDLRTLEALGLDRRQILTVVGAGPGVATVLGTARGLGVAVMLSVLFPSGLAGKYESAPGMQVAVGPLAVGGPLIVTLGLLGAWWSARVSLRSGSGSPIHPPSLAGSWLGRWALA